MSETKYQNGPTVVRGGIARTPHTLTKPRPKPVPEVLAEMVPEEDETLLAELTIVFELFKTKYFELNGVQYIRSFDERFDVVIFKHVDDRRLDVGLTVGWEQLYEWRKVRNLSTGGIYVGLEPMVQRAVDGLLEAEKKVLDEVERKQKISSENPYDIGSATANMVGDLYKLTPDSVPLLNLDGGVDINRSD